VDLILLREYLEAPNILADFGVDPSRVIVTGDDAIEMAYQNYSHQRRAHIGVGFRVAHTTEATTTHMEVLRVALQQATAKYKCQLIGLPVSQSAHELDQSIIEGIFANSPYRHEHFQRLCRPEKLIKDTALCRVVVTGTYHTAVFALSQGIPAIGLVQSASYINKFEGLADQFKGGMEVLRLDDEALYDKLIAAIDRAWNLDDAITRSLLQSARRQIELGKSGYQQLFQIVNSSYRKQGMIG
jgi:polysaccharide pyruvyl transferase WcaK-like protein